MSVKRIAVCRNVVIAMEALDQLLMACHSQSIKPFVESFLHMVAKLLESREPDLQVLGTNSVRRKHRNTHLKPFFYMKGKEEESMQKCVDEDIVNCNLSEANWYSR